MNHAKWWVPPGASAWVVVAFLLGTVVIGPFPSVADNLALHAPLWSEPLNPLRLATFSFVHVGLVHWLQVAVFVMIAAVVLKGRVDERWMLLALVGGAAAGALAFGLSTPDGVLIGGHVAGWGLAGAAVGVFARGPRRFGGWRCAYVLLLMLVAAALAISGRYPPIALLVAGSAGALIGFVASDMGEDEGPRPTPGT